MKLTEWCDVIGATLQVTYYPNQNTRWCAAVEGMEIKDGGCLATFHGKGNAPYDAILALLRKCQGKTVVFNAYKSNRIEYIFPKNLEI